jgi:hypothetical protein
MYYIRPSGVSPNPGGQPNHVGSSPHLLHIRLAIGIGLSLLVYLVLGVDGHGDPQKLLVEERNTSLDTESHRRWGDDEVVLSKPVRRRKTQPDRAGPGSLTLVGSETIADVQVLDTLDTFLVEDLGSRSGVEVEVPSEDFIGTFSGQDHLDTSSLDLSAVRVKRRRGDEDDRQISLRSSTPY